MANFGAELCGVQTNKKPLALTSLKATDEFLTSWLYCEWAYEDECEYEYNYEYGHEY